jgi:hypothetical protein
MHQNHGQIKPPLQKPEVSQQFGHLSSVIFIDGMQADQRIEQQQPRPQPLGGLQKPVSVGLAIQSQRRRGDHMDLHADQLESAMSGHALDALPHGGQGILR